MTDNVTPMQADIDTVRHIRLSDQVWYQRDRVARHRIEAQRPLLEALEAVANSGCECDPAYSTHECLRCKARAAIKQAKG